MQRQPVLYLQLEIDHSRFVAGFEYRCDLEIRIDVDGIEFLDQYLFFNQVLWSKRWEFFENLITGVILISCDSDVKETSLDDDHADGACFDRLLRYRYQDGGESQCLVGFLELSPRLLQIGHLFAGSLIFLHNLIDLVLRD